MSDQKSNNINVFATGAILGALATFLFATKSGRKIKDELIAEGVRIFDALAEGFEEAPEKMEDAKKEIRKELKEKGEQIAEIKQEVADAAQQVKKEVQDVASGVADAAENIPQQVHEIQKKGRKFFFSKKPTPHES